MSKLWKRDQDRATTTKDGIHNSPDGGSLGNARGKCMTSGFHHIALVCKSMRETVTFYEQAMGMKLRAVFPMHGIEGAKHCFLEAGNGAEISFVEFQSKPPIDLPGFVDDWSVGLQHHMAYACNTLEQMKQLREQIKATGTPVSPIIDHGFCHSCYFDDPNGYHLELACTSREYLQEDYQVNLIDKPNARVKEHNGQRHLSIKAKL